MRIKNPFQIRDDLVYLIWDREDTLVQSGCLTKINYSMGQLLSQLGRNLENIPVDYLNVVMIGRLWSHIWRLSQGSLEEQDFALNYAYHHIGNLRYGTVDPRYAVISGEGYDTTMFWTLTPFLFQKLMTLSNGNSEVCLAALQKWSTTGVSDAESRDPLPSVHLAGLEFLNENSTPITWILKEGDPTSYELADMTAQYLVDNGFIPLIPTES